MLKLSFSFVVAIALFSFSFTDSGKSVGVDQTPGSLEESVKKGKTIYSTYCIACHMENGKGMEGAFPPLAGSDYLKADRKRAINVVMHGLTGEITVNGKKYNSAMPDFGLNDEQIADVLNYVNNSWGNKDKIVTVAEVKAVRNAKK